MRSKHTEWRPWGLGSSRLFACSNGWGGCQPGLRRLRDLLLATAVCTGFLAGCAVHHSDPRAGVDEVWGFGCVRCSTNPVGARFQAVAAETVVPGLSLEFGADHVGVSLGYAESQHLVVEPLAEGASCASDARHALAIPLWRSRSGRVWAFGWQRIRASSRFAPHRQAFVTGRAVAGFGVLAGRDGMAFHGGAHAIQATVVQSPDTYLTFESSSARWPYFDLMALTVGVPSLQSQPESESWSQSGHPLEPSHTHAAP